LRAHGFRADGRLAEGWPPDEILGVIEGSRNDMTLMGSGSASWLGRVLLGSVATKVLHASTSSVLIAHNAPGDSLPQVLYGTDGSRGAQFALRALMEFADPGRVAVRVVSVRQPTLALGLPAMVPGGLVDSDEQSRRLVAEADVSRATDLLADAGFEATGEVLTGHPTEQLLEAADSIGVGLVAVGSRGLSAFERTVLGSVSEKVVHHARAALLGRSQPRDLSRDAAWPATNSAGSQPG
jgi:nucleotide-binding universal stress UspA family protein